MWAAKFSSRCSEEGFRAMSRVGKRPVAIPSGVTASVEGQTVKMKGPKGQLQFVVHDDVEVKFEDGAVKVAPKLETNRAQAMYGTARAQVANLVEGVYAIPEGITIVVPKPTEITITGTDSQRVGQVAAEIRAYRPPEPYKGKG